MEARLKLATTTASGGAGSLGWTGKESSSDLETIMAAAASAVNVNQDDSEGIDPTIVAQLKARFQQDSDSPINIVAYARVLRQSKKPHSGLRCILRGCHHLKTDPALWMEALRHAEPFTKGHTKRSRGGNEAMVESMVQSIAQEATEACRDLHSVYQDALVNGRIPDLNKETRARLDKDVVKLWKVRIAHEPVRAKKHEWIREGLETVISSSKLWLMLLEYEPVELHRRILSVALQYAQQEPQLWIRFAQLQRKPEDQRRVVSRALQDDAMRSSVNLWRYAMRLEAQLGTHASLTNLISRALTQCLNPRTGKPHLVSTWLSLAANIAAEEQTCHSFINQLKKLFIPSSSSSIQQLPEPLSLFGNRSVPFGISVPILLVCGSTGASVLYCARLALLAQQIVAEECNLRPSYSTEALTEASLLSSLRLPSAIQLNESRASPHFVQLPSVESVALSLLFLLVLMDLSASVSFSEDRDSVSILRRFVEDACDLLCLLNQLTFIQQICNHLLTQFSDASGPFLIQESCKAVTVALLKECCLCTIAMDRVVHHPSPPLLSWILHWSIKRELFDRLIHQQSLIETCGEAMCIQAERREEMNIVWEVLQTHRDAVENCSICRQVWLGLSPRYQSLDELETIRDKETCQVVEKWMWQRVLAYRHHRDEFEEGKNLYYLHALLDAPLKRLRESYQGDPPLGLLVRLWRTRARIELLAPISSIERALTQLKQCLVSINPLLPLLLHTSQHALAYRSLAGVLLDLCRLTLMLSGATAARREVQIANRKLMNLFDSHYCSLCPAHSGLLALLIDLAPLPIRPTVALDTLQSVSPGGTLNSSIGNMAGSGRNPPALISLAIARVYDLAKRKELKEKYIYKALEASVSNVDKPSRGFLSRWQTWVSILSSHSESVLDSDLRMTLALFDLHRHRPFSSKASSQTIKQSLEEVEESLLYHVWKLRDYERC